MEHQSTTRFKSIILPYVETDDNVFLLLGKAPVGNYGYLGGTQELGEDIIQTAAREFWEETKKLIPIQELEKRLKYSLQVDVLRKVYKNITYYFFIIPWRCLSNTRPEHFIQSWQKQHIPGDRFNEKIDIKLVHIDNHDQMTRTVRMIIKRVKNLILFQQHFRQFLACYHKHIIPSSSTCIVQTT